jgi:hypothetical protein
VADLDARQQARERRPLNSRTARTDGDDRIDRPVVTKHKCKIGQLVHFYPKGAGRMDSAPGQYQITRRLPAGEDGEFWYEIRSTLEEYDRVATERELSRA